MRQLSLYCGLICALLLSNHTFAQAGLGTLGLSLTAANIVDSDSSEITSELNDSSTAHLTVSYDLGLTDFFSIGVGYLHGDSSELTSFLDLFTDSKLEYKSLFVSAKVFIPLSDSDQIYLDVSRHDFDYDVIDDDSIVASDDGRDYGYSIGWQHKFSNQVGLRLGYDVTNLGEFIEIKGAKVGVTYRF